MGLTRTSIHHVFSEFTRNEIKILVEGHSTENLNRFPVKFKIDMCGLLVTRVEHSRPSDLSHGAVNTF